MQRRAQDDDTPTKKQKTSGNSTQQFVQWIMTRPLEPPTASNGITKQSVSPQNRSPARSGKPILPPRLHTQTSPDKAPSQPPTLTPDQSLPKNEKPGSFIMVSDLPETISRLQELDVSDIQLSPHKERTVNPFSIRITYNVSSKQFITTKQEGERSTIRNRLLKIFEDTPHMIARIAKVSIEGPFEEKKPGHKEFINELRRKCIEGFDL
jgi:hypothetical protein